MQQYKYEYANITQEEYEKMDQVDRSAWDWFEWFTIQLKKDKINAKR